METTMEKIQTGDSVPNLTIRTDGMYAAVYNFETGHSTKCHAVFAVSKGNEFLETISGERNQEVIDLLLRAVNNRTIERDYFRLYCDLLDGSITEEDYEKEIMTNESQYVVQENVIPTEKILSIALKLAEHIKSVSSISDFTSLFSFKNSAINLLVKK